MKTQMQHHTKLNKTVLTNKQHQLVSKINKATVALNKLEPFKTINVKPTQNTGLI